MTNKNTLKILILLVCLVSLYYISFYNQNKIFISSKRINENSLKNDSKNHTKAYVTVVCIYFQFSKSKHSESSFKNWLENTLKSVHSPLVIYTDHKHESQILSIRKQLNLPTKIVTYDTIWDIMHELEQSRNISYIQNYKTKQNSKFQNFNILFI